MTTLLDHPRIPYGEANFRRIRLTGGYTSTRPAS